MQAILAIIYFLNAYFKRLHSHYGLQAYNLARQYFKGTVIKASFLEERTESYYRLQSADVKEANFTVFF